MAPTNVIRYAGTSYAPQDVRRRRKQTQETMRRMGSPVIVKHMFNDDDVRDGIAEQGLNFDDVYAQTRADDPISHGIGFVSVEKSPDEWILPDGSGIVKATTKPSVRHHPAPKYRGFGPGFLIYMILPDVAEDVFKLTETGVLIKTQSATAQAPWYPEINDNDLVTAVILDRTENVIGTRERYQAKMTNPITMRGIDRRGRREGTEDGGNRLMIGQQFEMSLVPDNNPLYNVEMDR